MNQRSRKPPKPKKPFMSVYEHDPTLRGEPGAWRSAFKARMGIDEALQAVKDAKKSPRQLLGVDRSAEWDEIRKAYRKLARQHHPDFGGNPAEFRTMQGAYEVLEHAHEQGKLSTIQ